MQIQQLAKKATISWCPLPSYGYLLAVGTIDGFVDQAFNTSSQLEIYEYSPGRSPQPLTLLGSTASPDGFIKVAWGKHSTLPMGVIVGAHSSGSITFWDARAILTGEGNALQSTVKKHTRSVQSLSFNAYQTNVLATASSDGGIFIWDLKDITNPTAFPPGNPTDVFDANLTAVQWNQKRPQILASISFDGRLTVWELKQKRTLVNLSVDPNGDARCRAIAWHPKEITTIAVGAQCNKEHVIQIWDLTNPFVPRSVLRGHTNQILSLSWSAIAPDLLLSSSQDCATVVWSVSKGAPIQQTQHSAPNAWNLDVQWSPILPATFSTTSLTGLIAINSLHDYCPTQTAGAMEHLPPPWLTKGPVRASFGFGGKIAYFNSATKNTTSGVAIGHFQSDRALTEQARRLDEAIRSGDLLSFCDQCIAALVSRSEHQEAEVWNYLKIAFSELPEKTILQILGFAEETIQKELQEWLQTLPSLEGETEDSFVASSTPSSSPSTSAFPLENEDNSKPSASSELENSIGAESLFGEDSIPTQESPFTSFNSSIHQTSFSNTSSIIEPSHQQVFAGLSLSASSFEIVSPDQIESNLTRAILIGDLTTAIGACQRLGRIGDALAIASCGGPELLQKTLDTYLQKNHQNSPLLRLVACLSHRNLGHIAEHVDLSSWKQALAFFLKHANKDQLQELVNVLASRLEAVSLYNPALLCYIAIGDIDRVLQLWLQKISSGQNHQEFLEKVLVFKTGLQRMFPDRPLIYSPLLINIITSHAELLVAEGSLREAMQFLEFVHERPEYGQTSAGALMSRIYYSIPQNAENTPAPSPQQEAPTQTFEALPPSSTNLQTHPHIAADPTITTAPTGFNFTPAPVPTTFTPPSSATNNFVPSSISNPSPSSSSPSPSPSPSAPTIHPAANPALAGAISFGPPAPVTPTLSPEVVAAHPSSHHYEQAGVAPGGSVSTGIERHVPPSAGVHTFIPAAVTAPPTTTNSHAAHHHSHPPLTALPGSGTGIEKPRLPELIPTFVEPPPFEKRTQPAATPPPTVEPTPESLKVIQLQSQAVAHIIAITGQVPARLKLAQTAAPKLEQNLAQNLKRNMVPAPALTLLEEIYTDLLNNNHPWASYRFGLLADKYWDVVGSEGASALKRLISAIQPDQ